MFYWNGFGPLSEPPSLLEAELWPRSGSYNGPFNHKILTLPIHCRVSVAFFIQSDGLLVIYSEVAKHNIKSLLLDLSFCC